MSETSGEDGGVKQDVLLRYRRQVAAAPGEAQTVVLHHRQHRVQQEEGSAVVLVMVFAPLLFISCTKPCISAMHSQAGARRGLHTKHLG